MAYVRLDKIKESTHIESVVSATDLVNGQFVALGALQEDGEARLVTASADVTKELVLHVSSPLTYREDEGELDFVLKAGKVGRGYVLEKGNIISISASAVTGSVTVGAKVAPATTGFTVESAPTGLHGEVIAKEVDAIAGNLVVIRIA